MSIILYYIVIYIYILIDVYINRRSVKIFELHLIAIDIHGESSSCHRTSWHLNGFFSGEQWHLSSGFSTCSWSILWYFTLFF